jgi:hypothetical protein
LGVLLVWLRESCDLVQIGPKAAPATGCVVGGRFWTSEPVAMEPLVCSELLVGLLVCDEDPEDPDVDVCELVAVDDGSVTFLCGELEQPARTAAPRSRPTAQVPG